MRSSPKFYLRNPKADSTSIFMNLKHQGLPTKWPIGMSIPTKLWDIKIQRPTKDTKLINEYKKKAPEIRSVLSAIETRIANVETIVKRYISLIEMQGGVFSKVGLVTMLNDQFNAQKGKVTSKNGITLNNYIDEFIEGITSGSLVIRSGKKKGQPYSDSAIKTYASWARQFVKYQESKGSLNWDDINNTMMSDYAAFHNSRGHSSNYLDRQRRCLKQVLQRSYEDGIHQNSIFRESCFKSNTVETTHIALTSEEVERIYNLDVYSAKRKKFDFHRKVFLIACYTALRLGDLQLLDKHHIRDIEKKKFIALYQDKTTDGVIIPINSKCLTILKSLDFKIGRLIEQQLNRDIKELCSLARITDIVELQQSVGGKKITVKKPKNECISIHSGRRTAITNLYRETKNQALTMAMSGHKSEASFRKYLKIHKEEKAIELAKADFFK